MGEPMSFPGNSPQPYQASSSSLGVRWTVPEPGQLQAQFPQYELLELIGRGGMGAVYKARQKALKRLVAVKILAREAGKEEMRFAERFQHEALAMARLNHSHIVNVHDAGETADGLLYFVMEHVEGRDLAQEIAQRGRLPETEVKAIALQVVDALAYAHANGIVHRDIKPANILLDVQGRVKVADFGLAKASEPLVSTLLTKSGTSMGTADFMAPETRKAGVADARSDLFSLGVTLYQMLTGDLPQGMFRLPSERFPELDPHWDNILCKTLEPEPVDRYQTAEELKRDLALVGGEQRSAGIDSIEPRPPRRRWVGIAAVLGAVLIGGAAWMLQGQKKAEPEKHASFDLAAFKAQMTAADVETQWALLKSKLDELNGSDVTILRNDEDKQRGRITYLGISNNGKELKDITPVAALPGVVSLFFHDVWLRDISCLKGMKLEQLGIFQSNLTDLSPLETMPTLWSLNLPNARGIQDFSVLKKLRVTLLYLNTTPHLKDISFVSEMSLRVLNIRDTGVTDLSPLAGTGIEELDCNADIPVTAELLRSLPKLKKLNGKPVEEWRQKAGANLASSPAGKEIDLLPLIDVKRNVIAGEWRMEDGRLSVSMGGNVSPDSFARLQLPYAPPEEYDFVIELEAQAGGSGIYQILTAHERSFCWVADVKLTNGMKAGFETIEGQIVMNRADGSVMRPTILQPGKRHVMIVEVRRDHLRSLLDGEALVTWGRSAESFQLLGIHPRVALRDASHIGLAVDNRAVTFHRISVREVGATTPWRDWLTPKLASGDFASSGWLREKAGVTTEFSMRGTSMINNDSGNCAVRLTYDLRASDGILITMRERKGSKRERELYVADDTGKSLYIGRMLPDRSGSVVKLVNRDYEADPTMNGPRVLEFRCVGDTLTATLKGATREEISVSAVDGVLDKGPCALVLKKGVLLRKAEVMELD